MSRLSLIASIFVATAAGAAERRIPFCPGAVPEAIHAFVDGQAFFDEFVAASAIMPSAAAWAATRVS